MDTFNRLIRKAPPTESTLPMYSSQGPVHRQRSHNTPTPTPSELQPSFEPVLMEALAPSQNRSVLPPGEASKVGRILLHQLRSPEWAQTLQVEGRGAQKVRVVGRSDPSQALKLEELQAQVDAQQELLSSFKQQLEEAGTREARAQDARKAAEEEAERHQENTLRAAETIRQAEEARKAAEALLKARQDAIMAVKEAKRQAEEDARKVLDGALQTQRDALAAAEEATRHAEEQARKAIEATRQAEARAAGVEAAAQKKLAAQLAKANEESETKRKQLEVAGERIAREALQAKEMAEGEARKAMEAVRRAEQRATNIEEEAQKKLVALLTKANEESEARQKQLKALEERMAQELMERKRAEGEEKQAPNEKQAARKKMVTSIGNANEESETQEERLVEKALLARARENKKGKRKEAIAGRGYNKGFDEEQDSPIIDVEMIDSDSDEDIRSAVDSADEGMEIDMADVSMPGALMHLDDSINVRDNRLREEDIRPRKSWQRAYGTSGAADTYAKPVRDDYVPPIPKPAREKRPIGGDGPKLKVSRPQLPPAAKPGERQRSAALPSGSGRKQSVPPPPTSSRPQPTPTARHRERQASAAPPSGSGRKASVPPVSSTQERESSAAPGASTSSFEAKSLAMLEKLQMHVDFLMGNSRPQRKGRWQRPPQFKVAPNRTRTAERTMTNKWVRKEMNELLLIEHDRDILEFTDIFNPKSSQALEMEQYEKDMSGEGPDLKPMIPNFAQLGGEWNNELWIMFRNHCIDIGQLDDDNEDEVREIFYNRFARLKYFLNAHNPKTGETEEDWGKRVQTTNKSKLDKQRRHNRRNTLYKTRMEICAAHLPSEDCTNPTANEEAYSQIYDVMERLGAEGMSSDESDTDSNGMTTFTAKRMAWRARWLTDMLLRVDKDYNRTNMFGNRKSGNPARHRQRRNGRVSVRGPPAKKPKNFYDEMWYGNLDAGEKRDLDVASDDELGDIEEDD